MSQSVEPPRPTTEKLVLFRAKPWMLGVGAVTLVAIMALVSLARRESRDSQDDEAEIVAEAPPAPSAPAAAPVVVPVEPIAPPAALPPQEPVNLKKPARIVEAAAPGTAAPARTASAPALATPWPAESPPVFAQPKGGATTPTKRDRPSAEAAEGAAEAAPAKVAPAEADLPSAKAAPPATAAAAPTGDEILARGQTAFDRGNYPEAIRRAKEAIAVGAAVPGHLLLADAYYHLQRYADALREYQATLALEPSNSLARRGRELAEKAGSAGH